jgi:hypothetical protein
MFVYACAHVSAMQSHVPHFRPDGRIVQTPYPVPSHPATLSHDYYYDDDYDCCCTWCEKQKGETKKFLLFFDAAEATKKDGRNKTKVRNTSTTCCKSRT